MFDILLTFVVCYYAAKAACEIVLDVCRIIQRIRER